MLRLGVVGYGYWGPNIVRNFSSIPGASVHSVCDVDARALGMVKKNFPKIEITDDYDALVKSRRIDAVAVVTPVSTHYELAKKALLNGKHLFIEKPFTASSAQAEELIEIAERKKLTIMVDHTFLFTGAVNKIKELISDGLLGELYYFDSTRINLGLFQKDVNVVWDLAPHDLSIMNFLIDRPPVAIAATGISHFDDDIENVAYITVYFSGNMIAHFNISWLSPVKIRTTLIGGDKRMIVWNDLVSDEKIRIYDRGVDNGHADATPVHPAQMSYRSGDMWAPKVEECEALRREAEYFVDCIDNNRKPFNDGRTGLDVVRMIEATVKSLKMGGEVVYL
ncbi:Gfo/Idh/MocA family protein [Geomesophilobacter sediminis]|uniref:Gfo/Idh/MocA family oxidoreductase n=1 Tax=Geomesophilobacter sediminis TaxID=2798584 RepID=A0A8J7JDQ7_9BACT|nr:Gfo/Idh/MocA family oxidoreductase [Geomesophilobacter sediminis]MBJ6725348.1 Gfo/Idh/MocA family oxidoreductase [Geomesophilobacter sediminis]